MNSPDIDVNTGLGDITLTAARRDFRRVSSVSRIGSAHLEIRGLRISAIKRPPGATAQVEGNGQLVLIARSGNDTVRVIVE